MPRIGDMVTDLVRIAGAGHVLVDEESRSAYSRDKSPFPGRLPDVVVRPADAAEVSAVVRLANARGLSLLPRGAGFSIAGFPPVEHAPTVFLDVRRLDRVVEIDEVNMTVTAQAGILTSALDAAVAERGFQVHTVAVPIRHTTLGGVLSGVFGGGIPLDSCAVGLTGQHVLAVKVVLPNGDLISTNAGGANRHRTSSTLFDGDGPLLTPMFIGDGGSFGVKVEATLSLTPAARFTHADAWLVPDLDSAWRAVRELSRLRELPFTWLSASLGWLPVSQESSWELDVVAAAGDKRVLDVQVEILERTLTSCGASKASAERRALSREFAVPGAAWTRQIVDLDRALLAFVFGNRDFCDGLRAVRGLLDQRFAERDLAALGLGLRTVWSPLTRHAVYTSISLTYDGSVPGAREETARLAREAYTLVSELGGYSEPHQGEVAGILARSWSPAYERLVAGLKATLDPNRILNPGLWEE